MLIKQIMHYTEPDEDRALTERALRTAERILGDINEAVREQEGRERLKVLSQYLWLGQGCVCLRALESPECSHSHSPSPAGGWT